MKEDGGCRICLGLGSDGKMVSPCRCGGSHRWVHLACLGRLHISEGNEDLRCVACNNGYTELAALHIARALWDHAQLRDEGDPVRLRVALSLIHI